MATTQLTLYNGALRNLGERRLATLADATESRRVLDEIWGTGNEAIKACLEEGLWNFACRVSNLPADPSITPGFGFQYGYFKPDDFVRTTHFTSDPALVQPIMDYVEAAGVWYTNTQGIYLRYVSIDTDTGLSFDLWPEWFVDVVEKYLAQESCLRLSESEAKLDRIREDYNKALIKARSRDAMESPVRMQQNGAWISSRGFNQTRRSGWRSYI